jgi:hypothetical protein
MQFENKGQEPVILINPTLAFGTGLKDVRFFFRAVYKNGKSLATKSSLKIVETSSDQAKDNFKSLAEYFEGPEPPENMTVIIKPGETFPFEE